MTADPPDVCFLDIQMPRLNGFEVLARLPSQPIVIFTTAYDQYALQAFGVNSVDYLLKPVEPEALERALRKLNGCGVRVSRRSRICRPSSSNSRTRCARPSRSIPNGLRRGWATGSGSSTWRG